MRPANLVKLRPAYRNVTCAVLAVIPATTRKRLSGVYWIEDPPPEWNPAVRTLCKSMFNSRFIAAFPTTPTTNHTCHRQRDFQTPRPVRRNRPSRVARRAFVASRRCSAKHSKLMCRYIVLGMFNEDCVSKISKPQQRASGLVVNWNIRVRSLGNILSSIQNVLIQTTSLCSSSSQWRFNV